MPDPATLFGIDLTSIRTRLKLLSYFTDVLSIQDGSQAMAEEISFLPPAAFVATASEDYEKNRYASGGFGQRATVRVSILFCIPAERAAGDQEDQMEAARKLIIAQLVGWVPTGADMPFSASGYRIRAIQDGLLWGEVIMLTSFDLHG